MNTTLIEVLKARQGNQSGNQWAARLGIDPSLWSRLRNGERTLERETLGRILAAFPADTEVKLLVLDYLEKSAEK